MRYPVKSILVYLKFQAKFLINLKLVISMQPVCLHMILPYNLIQEKRINLIERTFTREGSSYLAYNDRNTFFTFENPKKHHAWSCQNVMR